MIYLTSVSDFFGTSSKKLVWSFYQRLFMSFFTEVPSQSLHTKIFIKHQNVYKHLFFVGLWHLIIITGRKTKNSRFYCFVLIVLFYTKEITYIFITLGSTCDCGDCDLFKIDKKKVQFEILWERKRFWEEKVKLFERGFDVLFTFFHELKSLCT